MNRAFSASVLRCIDIWGVAPGLVVNAAPLALSILLPEGEGWVRVNIGASLLIPPRNRFAQNSVAPGSRGGKLLVQFLQKSAIRFSHRKPHFLQLYSGHDLRRDVGECEF